MNQFRPPVPRSEVGDPRLVRPDWTKSESRDPTKLWLDKNENVDPELAAVVRRALTEVPVEGQWTYPDTARLYGKLAAQIGVEPRNIVLTAGADGLIRAVFEAYVRPGDAVIHTEPTFAMYSVYAQMYGARATTIDYELSQSGPKLPSDRMIDAIRASRPRVVCIPNPDSPTGAVLGPQELREVIEAAGNAGSLILIDEAYYPFHAETIIGWMARYPHLVVARSTGKAWGMAGFRIGYGVASAEVAQNLQRVRPMYEVNTIAAWVFEGMLDQYDAVMRSVERLEQGKAMFLGAMDRLGFATLKGAGNFLHVAFDVHAGEMHRALADLVYYRKDFSHPSLQGFSRFSSATETQFAPIVERIRSVVVAGRK